jgi:hypothetical protein
MRALKSGLAFGPAHPLQYRKPYPGEVTCSQNTSILLPVLGVIDKDGGSDSTIWHKTSIRSPTKDDVITDE